MNSPIFSAGGEKRRTITFNLGKEHDLNLYKFSLQINLSQFVKHHLAEEYNRVIQLRKQKGVDQK